MNGLSAKENYSPKPAPAAPDAIQVIADAACAGQRLDQALARLLPEYSRSRLATWIREERVMVDGLTATPRQKMNGGERITVQPAASADALAHQPENIPLRVVFEDEHILVIDKPAGLVVHPGSGNWAGTMLNALLQHAPVTAELPRAGIVHRLDKETSGLLVVAKTLAAQTDLVRQLQARTVSREYDAVVHGRVQRAGTVDAPIGRHAQQRTKMAVVPGGKPAITHYEVVKGYAHTTWLRCHLETGRTHQIRVHLASIGHPLVGDPVYGFAARRTPLVPPFPRQALHAARLALVHPATHKTVAWEAPLPADMSALIEQLENGTA